MPTLTVVVPAYNEAHRIGPSLLRICSFLGGRPGEFEVLVVDDGSEDDTVDIARALELDKVEVLRLDQNRGKGAAVREGVRHARCDRILFTDADLSTPIEDVEELEKALDQGATVAIGSRGLSESRISRRQPIWRDSMGRIFNFILRALGLTRLRDTQCGFKLFESSLAKAVFSSTEIPRFAFDVEALLLAEDLGAVVVEVPVRWNHVEESRVRPLVDSANMIGDVLRLWVRRWRRRGVKDRGRGSR